MTRLDRDAGGSGRTPSPAPPPMSVLAGDRVDDVQSDPFFHLVRKDCLPARLYHDLAAAFPPTDVILGSREARLVNAAARLPAFKVLDNPAIAPMWRDFFAFHTSEGFWKDIVRVFGAALRATHPGLERQAGKVLDDWRAGP